MPRNILLIQDDPAAAELVRHALVDSSDGAFEVVWTGCCAEAVERLAPEAGKLEVGGAGGIAAILVDLNLRDSRGIETFERLFRAAPRIPILVLAAAHDEPAAIAAVQHGAQDYLLTSSLDGDALLRSVENMVERAANAEALPEDKERAQATLDSIGDAVMSTDLDGRVTYLNVVAEGMTGWSNMEAAGRPVEDVLHVIDANTRATVRTPMAMAIRENKPMALTPNCVLVRRDGVEASIEDSTAPIHDCRGRITGAVIVFRDVTAARAKSTRLSHLAQHDDLTNLPNRAVLDDRLGQAIASAQRHRQKLAVLFLDVDRFKYINDSLGHDVGDRLLQLVAQRLVACVRSSDTVSRQGGDEFVVLLPEVARAADAAISAEKILLALRSPYVIEQHDLHITVSIGIATYPDAGTAVDELKKSADLAMYHAKDCGRDNYQFFKPNANVRSLKRQSVCEALGRAIKRNDFVLHYQPQMNLETGAIMGVEALVRWRHPQRGLLFPAHFISIAEERGLIAPIGWWVLREACRQTRKWLQEGDLPRSRVAVNISAAELRTRNFVSGVRAILKETGLEPSYLELELTETCLVQDAKSSTDALHALKDLGVYLALDDFGTGYSSLTHLKRFPIDTLKIDRSFVRDLTTNAKDASILSAVIGLGKSLHMRVVAEGVETATQLAVLRKRGCPEAQGYYFGRPMVAEKITQLLETRVSLG